LIKSKRVRTNGTKAIRPVASTSNSSRGALPTVPSSPPLETFAQPSVADWDTSLEDASSNQQLWGDFIALGQQPSIERTESLRNLQENASIPRHIAEVPLRDVAFFDELKRIFNSRSLWNEFLRVLNLYTMKMISIQELVDLVYIYLGDNKDDGSLMEKFKEIIAWDVEVRGKEAGGGRIKGEEWYVENEAAADRAKVDISRGKQWGPSYRKLPQTVRESLSKPDPIETENDSIFV
jgi:histone deacetylase complex regulatory component SIN3